MFQENKMTQKLLNVLTIVAICTQIYTCQNKLSSVSRLPVAYQAEVKRALNGAASNAREIIQAIENCPEQNLEGMGFLLANMPGRDLRSLRSEFILTNVNLSYAIMDSIKWGEAIPEDIFLNYILPYVSMHERRDNWRPDFINKFLPLVRDLSTPSEATLKLNDEIWGMVNVKYSTKRPKADQSPYESIEAGLASCTGLSILLIDACRAVGVPARFVGVPLWTDHSGNHSWVEIWDDGWHFIGAAEKSPLDKTWFGERAVTSNDSEWKYSIYATSYKKTNVVYPPLFDKSATYVSADIITDRYSKEVGQDGLINLAIRLFDIKNGERIVGKISVMKGNEKVAEGETKDEKFDFNDFLIFRLQPNESYTIIAEANGKTKKTVFDTEDAKYQFCKIYMQE
jgi:hypothetical protein